MGIVIENKCYDEERALYGSDGLTAVKCRFDGPADGESAFKESKNVLAKDCFYNLRYPFWHNENLVIEGGEMTDKCRAALWYDSHVKISNLKMHGIKALRECSDVEIDKCDVISPEFGWSVNNIRMTDTDVQSEYFMMRSANLDFENVTLKGKYSFQYIHNSSFVNCNFDTKDAFWHAENVYVKDSVIRGEYLAWYSNHLTLDHCKIYGTQPLCYCKNLKLIDCEMYDADLAFEKSEVDAVILTPIISIKSPYTGNIVLPESCPVM